MEGRKTIADNQSGWAISFEKEKVIEIKFSYYTPRKPNESEFLVGRPETTERLYTKGLAKDKRKSELVLYYTVVKWNQPVLIDLIQEGFIKYLLTLGFLPLQSGTTMIRIRDMSNASTRERVVVIPIRNLYGSAGGTWT